MLKDHYYLITIGERPICSLQYPCDIDPPGDSNNDLQDLINRLKNRAGAYGMELKVIVKSTKNISANITINGETLKKVETFVLGNDFVQRWHQDWGDLIRLATAAAAMARLNRILKSKFRFHTKYKLFLHQSGILSCANCF